MIKQFIQVICFHWGSAFAKMFGAGKRSAKATCSAEWSFFTLECALGQVGERSGKSLRQVEYKARMVHVLQQCNTMHFKRP